MRKTSALGLVTALLAISAPACSSTSPTAAGNRVVVVEHDFGVTVSPASVAAGPVTLHIENRGPSTHELILVRANLPPNALPQLVDTLQIDEHSRQLTKVLALEQIRYNTTHDVTVQLKPGHYVLFCNLEGHYLGGMNVSLQVRE